MDTQENKDEVWVELLTPLIGQISSAEFTERVEDYLGYHPDRAEDIIDIVEQIRDEYSNQYGFLSGWVKTVTPLIEYWKSKYNRSNWVKERLSTLESDISFHERQIIESREEITRLKDELNQNQL